MNDDDDEVDTAFDDEDEGGRICSHCRGTGGDPWNDRVLPCPVCNGEGSLWWLA